MIQQTHEICWARSENRIWVRIFRPNHSPAEIPVHLMQIVKSEVGKTPKQFKVQGSRDPKYEDQSPRIRARDPQNERWGWTGAKRCASDTNAREASAKYLQIVALTIRCQRKRLPQFKITLESTCKRVIQGYRIGGHVFLREGFCRISSTSIHTFSRYFLGSRYGSASLIPSGAGLGTLSMHNLSRD